jgi:hypothetical protein
VEEKDMNLEPDEDVQAHQNQVNLEADEKGVHHREDEGEDVEGHVHHRVNQAADAVNLAHDDEDDDVEGHVNY